MLTMIGGLIVLVALVGSLVFGIQLLIQAFSRSVLWGLAYLFIPMAALIFVFVNWSESGRPFLRGLGCALLAGLGAGMMGMGG